VRRCGRHNCSEHQRPWISLFKKLVRCLDFPVSHPRGASIVRCIEPKLQRRRVCVSGSRFFLILVLPSFPPTSVRACPVRRPSASYFTQGSAAFPSLAKHVLLSEDQHFIQLSSPHGHNLAQSVLCYSQHSRIFLIFTSRSRFSLFCNTSSLWDSFSITVIRNPIQSVWHCSQDPGQLLDSRHQKPGSACCLQPAPWTASRSSLQKPDPGLFHFVISSSNTVGIHLQ